MTAAVAAMLALRQARDGVGRWSLSSRSSSSMTASGGTKNSQSACVEQMRDEEAVELAYAAELDVGRHRVLRDHLRVAPLGDDDAIHRLALHLVDGDGAGWHERKLRELDRETPVELGREGLLDR